MQLLSWCWQRPIHCNTCPRGDVLVILICWCLWKAFPNRISSKDCPNFLSSKGFIQGENAPKSVSAADRTPLGVHTMFPDLLVGSRWDTLSIYFPPLDAFVFSISARTAPRLSALRENCTNPALHPTPSEPKLFSRCSLFTIADRPGFVELGKASDYMWILPVGATHPQSNGVFVGISPLLKAFLVILFVLFLSLSATFIPVEP